MYRHWKLFKKVKTGSGVTFLENFQTGTAKMLLTSGKKRMILMGMIFFLTEPWKTEKRKKV